MGSRVFRSEIYDPLRRFLVKGEGQGPAGSVCHSTGNWKAAVKELIARVERFVSEEPDGRCAIIPSLVL